MFSGPRTRIAAPPGGRSGKRQLFENRRVTSWSEDFASLQLGRRKPQSPFDMIEGLWAMDLRPTASLFAMANASTHLTFLSTDLTSSLASLLRSHLVRLPSMTNSLCLALRHVGKLRSLADYRSSTQVELGKEPMVGHGFAAGRGSVELNRLILHRDFLGSCTCSSQRYSSTNSSANLIKTQHHP